jgi:hypothetical protein
MPAKAARCASLNFAYNAHMASPNITETMSLTHAVVATAPASGTSPKSVATSATKTNQTGSRAVSGIQQATVAAAAIDISALGGGALGRFAIKNLDGINNLILLTQVTTGVAFVDLLPGEMCQGRFGSGVTGPAIQSSAATVLCEYVICEA